MSELHYTEYNASPGSTHEHLRTLVGSGRRVLDVGCATGYLAERMTASGCSVVGIEIDETAAALAREHCADVVVADIDGVDLATLVEGPFDVVLFGDVLEHLRDPLRPLASAAGVLADDGWIVASVPNVAHVSVRLALLAGEFTYSATGLLDRTHLRFFTPRTFEDFLEEAGFLTTRRIRQRVAAGMAEIPVPAGTSADLVEQIEAADPDATTYQIIVQAVSMAAAPRAATTALRDAVAAAEGETERAAQLADKRAAEIAELRVHIEAVEREVAALNADLAAGHERLEALRLENAVLTEDRDDLAGRLVLAEAAFDDRPPVELQQQIDAMAATRLWRVGSAYWKVRDRLFRRAGL
jgi:2-polyprenyl-3-methyl-5-hydroxy-6-metoxy-1,4-benzoquinol methylase